MAQVLCVDKKLSVKTNKKVETFDTNLSKEGSYKCLSPSVLKYIEQIQQYRQPNVSENKNSKNQESENKNSQNKDNENKNSQNKDNENNNNLQKIELKDQNEKIDDYQYEDEPNRKSIISRIKNFIWSSDMDTKSKIESENKIDNMILSNASDNTKTTRSSDNYQNTKKEPEQNKSQPSYQNCKKEPEQNEQKVDIKEQESLRNIESEPNECKRLSNEQSDRDSDNSRQSQGSIINRVYAGISKYIGKT